MLQPGRLSVPGEGAVRARVEAVFDAADRLSPPELWLPDVPRRDEGERRDLVADLEELASRYGRRPLLDEARGRVRDELMERAVSRSVSSSGAMGQQVGGRAEDLTRLLAAIEDAVAVAVVEDVLDPAAAATLANPGRILLGLMPLPGRPQEPAARPGPVVADDDVASDELADGELTQGDEVADDALADGDLTEGDQPADGELTEGDEVADDELADDELARGDRQARRAAVFVIVAAVAVTAAMSFGGLAGSLPLLLVVVAASLLLAWLFG